MRRVITQIGQSIYEWLFTRQAQDNMVALSKLSAAVLGTTTQFNGLAVSPTSPASMQVSVAPGEIYMQTALEQTVYGTLAADTTHQIVKQGISLDATLLTLTAPSVAGQSINYLIQATFQETDISVDPTNGTSPVVLQFYNDSNPTVPYNGPNNSGQTSNTFRQGSVVLSAKAGIAATTGSQVTPSPDAGYVGIAVVTVANGQSTITSGNISSYTGAPIITERLGDKISLATADARYARGSTLQPGDVVDVSSNNLPANRIWMPTAPTNLPRASYPALFAQIGTTWGIGDGSTTFGIPYCPPDYAIVHANGNISTSTVGQVIQHVHGPASGNGFWVDQAGLYTVQAGGGTANLNSATSTTSTGGAANLAAGIRFRKTIVYQ